VNPNLLQPRRHDPPAGWPPEVFEAVTAAIAAALVSAARRRGEADEEDHA
jgi:hypothetical protein